MLVVGLCLYIIYKYMYIMEALSNEQIIKIKINDFQFNINKIFLEDNSTFFKLYFEEFDDVDEYIMEDFIYDIDQQLLNDIMNYFINNDDEFTLINYTNEKMLIALYLFDYFQFDKAIISIKNNFNINKKNINNNLIDIFKKYIYNDNIKDILIDMTYYLVLNDQETENIISLNEIRKLDIEIITLILNENSINYLKIIKSNFKNIIINYDNIYDDAIFYNFIKECEKLDLKENNITLDIHNLIKINMHRCILNSDACKYKEYFLAFEKLNNEHIYYDELLKDFTYNNFDIIYNFFILIKDDLFLFEEYEKIVNNFDEYITHQMIDSINENIEEYKKYFIMRKNILNKFMTCDHFMWDINIICIKHDDFLNFYNFIKNNKNCFGDEYSKVKYEIDKNILTRLEKYIKYNRKNVDENVKKYKEYCEMIGDDYYTHEKICYFDYNILNINPNYNVPLSSSSENIEICNKYTKTLRLKRNPNDNTYNTVKNLNLDVEVLEIYYDIISVIYSIGNNILKNLKTIRFVNCIFDIECDKMYNNYMPALKNIVFVNCCTNILIKKASNHKVSYRNNNYNNIDNYKKNIDDYNSEFVKDCDKSLKRLFAHVNNHHKNIYIYNYDINRINII